MWHNREYFHIVRQQLFLWKKYCKPFRFQPKWSYSLQNKIAQNVLEVSPYLIFNIQELLLSQCYFYYSES